MATATIERVKPKSPIQQRFRQVIEEVLLKDFDEAAREMGIAKGTLDNIVNGRVESIKDIHLAALVKAYRNVNLNYILTGEGSPLVADQPEAPQLLDALRRIRKETDILPDS